MFIGCAMRSVVEIANAYCYWGWTNKNKRASQKGRDDIRDWWETHQDVTEAAADGETGIQEHKRQWQSWRDNANKRVVFYRNSLIKINTAIYNIRRLHTNLSSGDVISSISLGWLNTRARACHSLSHWNVARKVNVSQWSHGSLQQTELYTANCWILGVYNQTFTLTKCSMVAELRYIF